MQSDRSNFAVDRYFPSAVHTDAPPHWRRGVLWMANVPTPMRVIGSSDVAWELVLDSAVLSVSHLRSSALETIIDDYVAARRRRVTWA